MLRPCRPSANPSFFNYVLNDFAPITPLSTSPLILLARKTMPAKDLDELIAWLKANPNKASAGTGVASTRILTAFFQKETATQFTRVPCRGEAPTIQDLVAGQIDLTFGSPVQLALVRAGSIKAYAVTSDARLSLAPDIPTFRELGLPTFVLCNLARFICAKGHAKGHYREAQRGGSGGNGRSGSARTPR
jgi:tripartite-type tricarboxylate transporter receptor subunit TctC